MKVNQTRLSNLPEHWKIKTIAAASEIPVSNGLYKEQDCYGKGPRMIHMTEVFAHDFISDQSMPHVALNDRELGKYLLKDGDLVFARRSLKPEGAGDVALVSPTGAMSFESSIIRARLKKDISSRFVLEYLKSPYGKAQMMTLVRQVAVSGITGEDLKKYQIPIPPLPEQKKIAQILSTWDQAITATERLLENSQQRKKGLMQQLLTGKKRLPGFEGEWVSSRLDELFTFKKGKGLSKSALVENGNHKCVLYGELYTKYGEVIRDVVSRCDDQDGLASKRGDILLPSSTTTNGIDLANATAVIEDGILLGGDIIVLRPIKQQDPIFFSHLITHIKKHEIAARAQGITIIHLYGSDLKDLVVKIPAKEAEQKVISEIMTTADKEIVGLSQRLASLKQEKKALMQQLLTGKRRVQVEAA